MEYRRSYWNEQTNWELVRQHEERIFPLMKKRYLFSGVSQFNLYDMYNSEHNVVHESVVAYTNGSGGKRVLVLFNNSSITCDGVLKHSVQKRDKRFNTLTSSFIADEIHIGRPGGFLLFEDLLSKQWYIRPVVDVVTDGFYWMIGPYEQRCFTSFRQVFSDDLHPWNALFDKVGYHSFANPYHLLSAVKYTDLEQKLHSFFSPKMVDKLFALRLKAFDARTVSTKRVINDATKLLQPLFELSLFDDFVDSAAPWG